MNTAKDIMVKSDHVVTFSPDESIGEAVWKLARNHISGGPVVRDGMVVGVISESDILRLATKSEYEDLEAFIKQIGSKKWVREVMSKNVVSVGPDAGIREVADRMSDRDINRVIVLDPTGALLGIIARHDLVKAAIAEFSL